MKRRIIAVFLILVALTVTLGVRTLTSTWLRDRLRTELERLARAELGAAVTFGEVEENFLLTRISLYRVSFTDISGRGLPPLTVRRIEAALDPLSPLRGRLAFRDVRIEGLDLTVERAPDGAFVIDPLSPFRQGAPGGGRGTPRVDSHTLLDAKVTFRDPGQGVEASLAGVMVRLHRGLLEPRGRYRAAVRARSGTLRWKGFPQGTVLDLRSLQAEMKTSPDSVEVEKLVLAAGSIDLSLSGHIPLDQGALRARVEASFDASRLPWKTGVEGRVELAGTLAGALGSPSFSGSISSPRLLSRGVAVEEVRGGLSLGAERAELRAASMRFLGERVGADGEVGFGEGLPFRVRAQVEGFPLEKAFAEAGVRGAPVKGTFSLRSEASGSLEGAVSVSAEGEARVTLDAGSGRMRAFSFQAAGVPSREGFELSRFTAASGGLWAEAKGTATAEGPRFSLSLRDPSPAGWEPLVPGGRALGGELDLAGAVEGTWENPVARADLRWSRPAWGEVRADLLQAHLDLDHEAARLPLATLKGGRTTVSLSGEVGWKGGGKASLSLPAGQLGDLLAALGSPLKGSGEVSASLELSSPPGVPDGEWSGRGEVSGRGLAVEGESADQARLIFRVAGGKVLLERSLVERAGKGLLLNGTIEQGGFAISLETREPFPLELVEAFTTINAPLAGEVNIRGQARGSFEDLREAEVDATVSSANLVYGGRSWRGAQAVMRIRRKNLSAEGTLFDGRMNAKVSLGLLGNLPFRGNLSGVRLTRGDLNDFLLLEIPADVGGELDAAVMAEGLLADTQTTKVSGTITKARFSVADLTFTALAPIPFTFHPPEGAFFSGLVLKTGESVLRGEVGLLPQGGLSGSVKGEIDVAGFPFLAPTVTDFAGKARVDLVASGSIASPRLEGYAELQGVSCLAHLPFALPLRGTTGRIEVLRDHLRFDGVRGEGGGGRVEMTGDLFFKGLSPNRGQLHWNAEGVTVDFPEGLTTKGRASVTLGFVEGKGSLRGTILADEGRYQMTVDLENLVGLIGGAALGKPPAEAPVNEGGEWLSLDLAMETVNPIDVDLKILRGKAFGALRLQGNAARPVLSGRLEISPATIEYRGKIFTVTQGWVGFFNPRVIEPSFDVRGRTLVSGQDAEGAYRDFTVDLSVTGTPAKVDLAFFSDPPLSKLDVIALLTWGSVTSRLLERAQEMGTVGATLLLATQLKGKIETEVQKFIGFDRFVINPARSSGTGERDVWVRVDKRLGDRLFLAYSTPLGATSDHEVELKYKVTDVFSILGSQKGENEIGLDLDFSFEVP